MNKDEQNGILAVDLDRNTKTIELMDQFENEYIPTASNRYEQLVLQNFFKVGFFKRNIYLSLVIEKSINMPHVGSITFTMLKQKKCAELEQYVRQQVTAEIIKEYENKPEPFLFENPFLLKAQTSCDLVTADDWTSIYGNASKKYGETTFYSIVGVYIGYCRPVLSLF